jgi:hypothetical protein
LKGALFFLTFFLIFATTTYFIPKPMFPSNVILNWVNASSTTQDTLIGALINGIAYSFIAWAIFAIAMERINKDESRQSGQTQVKNQTSAKSERRSKKSRR